MFALDALPVVPVGTDRTSRLGDSPKLRTEVRGKQANPTVNVADEKSGGIKRKAYLQVLDEMLMMRSYNGII